MTEAQGQGTQPVTCFSCPQRATGITRRWLNDQDGDWHGEVDSCDEHRDPQRWTQRTAALFARIARRVSREARDAVADIAQEFIEEGLD
jgi:hypothetical protein